MTKQTIHFLLFFLLLSISSYAQITFEKGYFIDRANEKTECFIKNVDWLNNPTSFEYRLTPNAPTQVADMDNVKIFVITDIAKYVRADVKIDRSSANSNSLSEERTPTFQNEQLFLRTLVEGEASLFEYVDNNLVRFFLSVDSIMTEQLVYKRYLNKNTN